MQNTESSVQTKLSISDAENGLIKKHQADLFLEFLWDGWAGDRADCVNILEDMVDHMADLVSRGYDYVDEGYPLLKGMRLLNQFRILMQKVALLEGHPIEHIIRCDSFSNPDLVISSQRFRNQLKKATRQE